MKPFFVLLTAFLVLVLLTAGLRAVAADKRPKLSKLEQVLFDQVNKDRKSQGVKTLQADARLCKVAREHAEDMLKNDYFGHVNSKGLNAQRRAREAGVTVPVYENIGWRSGPDPAEEMVLTVQKSFMNEPKDQRNHRYILLLKKLKFVGIGVAKKKDQVALVQVFAESSSGL